MTRYVGRFAPAPTGPLHFGSLVTALASWLDARVHVGQWLVRIEDIDHPRVVPGAGDQILRTLDAYGLYWDGSVIWQGMRRARYAEGLARLEWSGRTYPCACTRRETGPGRPYDGRCRAGLPAGRQGRAVRLRVDANPIEFEDRVQGRVSQSLADVTGDFIVRRADALIAYHLAVVIDDADQGVTHIVRGADLLDSTPRQIHLQRCLAAATPAYAHVPVAVDAQGTKLSKQNGAPALPQAPDRDILAAALRFLGHDPGAGRDYETTTRLLDAAIAGWRMHDVPRTSAQAAPAPFCPARPWT